VDIMAELSVNAEALKISVGHDVINNCSAAAVRQASRPFGLLVLADNSFSELTPVYFHIAQVSDGTVKHWFCIDLSRYLLGCQSRNLSTCEDMKLLGFIFFKLIGYGPMIWISVTGWQVVVMFILQSSQKIPN